MKFIIYDIEHSLNIGYLCEGTNISSESVRHTIDQFIQDNCISEGRVRIAGLSPVHYKLLGRDYRYESVKEGE